MGLMFVSGILGIICALIGFVFPWGEISEFARVVFWGCCATFVVGLIVEYIGNKMLPGD